jgi:hypothetical protein
MGVVFMLLPQSPIHKSLTDLRCSRCDEKFTHNLKLQVSLCFECRSQIAKENGLKRSLTKYGSFNLSCRAKQVLLGSIIGDGCIVHSPSRSGNLGIKIMHGLKQRDYCKWKASIIGIGSLKEGQKRSSFTKDGINKFISYCSPVMPQIANVLNPYLKNGKKCIADQIINELDLFGIAIWYFDDGSIQKPKRYKKHAKDANIRFSTCAFSIKKKGKKWPGIRLYGDDVRTFINKIKSVEGIQQAGMNYKIPDDLEIFWKRSKITPEKEQKLIKIFGSSNQSQLARDLKFSRKKVWDMMHKSNPWDFHEVPQNRLDLTMKLFGTTNQSEASRRFGYNRKKIWEMLRSASRVNYVHTC